MIHITDPCQVVHITYNSLNCVYIGTALHHWTASWSANILGNSTNASMFCCIAARCWSQLAATLWWFTAAPKCLKIQVFWGSPSPQGSHRPYILGDTTRPGHVTCVLVWSKSDRRRLRKTLHKQTDKQTDRQTNRHYENNGHLAVNQYSYSQLRLRLRTAGIFASRLRKTTMQWTGMAVFCKRCEPTYTAVCHLRKNMPATF